MYHSIAESDCDPWGNCVSPKHFEQQLDVLKRWAQPQPLRKMTDSIAAGVTPRRSVALTFDDGYADNYHVARPLLEERDLPATFFLVSARVGSSESYWWDDLTDLLLRPGDLPETLDLPLGGQRYEIRLGPSAHYSAEARSSDRNTRAWAAKPGTRLGFYYDVWRRLKALSERERREAMDRLRVWAREATSSKSGAAITINRAEAHELAVGGLIEIGSHSRSHPSFPDLNPVQQRQEMADSRSALEEIIEKPLDSFAYPYGNYDQNTPRLAKEAGFSRACTVDNGQVRPGGDPFLLPRFGVLDWNGEEFERRLSAMMPS